MSNDCTEWQMSFRVTKWWLKSLGVCVAGAGPSTAARIPDVTMVVTVITIFDKLRIGPNKITTIILLLLRCIELPIRDYRQCKH